MSKKCLPACFYKKQCSQEKVLCGSLYAQKLVLNFKNLFPLRFDFIHAQEKKMHRNKLKRIGRGSKGKKKKTVKDLDLSFKIFSKIFPFSRRRNLLPPKINILWPSWGEGLPAGGHGVWVGDDWVKLISQKMPHADGLTTRNGGTGDPPALGSPLPPRVKARAEESGRPPSQRPSPALGPPRGSLVAGIQMRK